MAIASYGTLLKIGDGGETESFTTIAGVRDISGPALGLDTEESTDHDSTDGVEEYVATIRRTGEVSFEINYEPAESTHDAGTGLIKDMTDRTLRNFQLVFTDDASSTWEFSAFVTAFEPSAPVAGLLAASVTLRPSGAPTLV